MQGHIKSRFSSGRSTELIPSGIPSLDTTLGGGFPLGSIVLIIEDDLGTYSDAFFKIFFAQGIVNNDAVILASPEAKSSFFESLPAVADPQQGPTVDDLKRDEPMTIAWRYGNSTTSFREAPKQLSLSSNFSFSKRISDDQLTDKSILYWRPDELDQSRNIFDVLSNEINNSALNHSDKVNKSSHKSHLRIGIHHLGSALWQAPQNEIPKFLFKLRCTAAQYPASVVVTLPSLVIKDPKIVSRCRQICDIVFQLVAIDPETNPLYSEYIGLLQLIKISPVNSLTPLAEITDDWAFKLIKKRILVERMTLPPELDTSTQREQVKDLPLCGSLQKKLDF